MRILLIEDDKRLSRLIKKALTDDHLMVDLAEDIVQGSVLACVNPYDLVILDESVSVGSSLTLCEEVRAYGRAMPILILSDDITLEHKVQLLNTFADDYLGKPFELIELVARARALLRRSPQLRVEVFTVDDITLCTKSGIVRRGDRDICLTRKEFLLLEYLMRNKGAILSRSQIMEHVWDMSVDLFSNTIESHIVSLRRKIGDTESPKRLITTISGRGYRIGT